MSAIRRHALRILGGMRRCSLAVSGILLLASQATGDCASDLNRDGRTGGRDLGQLFAAWQTSNPSTDLNGDGVTDGVDLQLMLEAWGSCDPTGGTIARIAPHVVGTGGIFTIEGIGLAEVEEVLVHGIPLDFEVGEGGLVVDVPPAFELGVAPVVVVGPRNIHRVRRGITVSAEEGGGSTFVPSFDLDYKGCGVDPQSGSGSINYLGGRNAGRFCSRQGYLGVTSVSATVDLSGLGSASDSGNMINATLYFVSNPSSPSTQAIGSNYCDCGGTPSDWTNCREIDLLETNGSKITQATLHLGDGGTSAPQRIEWSFTENAQAPCFTPPSSGDSAAGLHDVTAMDMSQPFTLTADFATAGGGQTNMKVTFTQNGNDFVVYDTTSGSGAETSGNIDLGDLTTQLNDVGVWLISSYYTGYTPAGPPSNPWYVGNNCGESPWCGGTVDGWQMTDISVVASGTL